MEYYDFYDETTEFDQQIDEFKKSLMFGVKQEFLDRLNNLEKENQELKEIKNNWISLVQEYENKKYMLEQEKLNAKTEARNQRLSELLKDNEIVLYKAEGKHFEKPKCDKCDRNRQIKYVSPQGRKVSEFCDCAIKSTKHFPQRYIWYEFRIDDYTKRLFVWYKKLQYDGKGYEYFEGEAHNDRVIYDSSMSYESLPYHTYFETETECQKYCEWLNNKKEE